VGSLLSDLKLVWPIVVVVDHGVLINITVDALDLLRFNPSLGTYTLKLSCLLIADKKWLVGWYRLGFRDYCRLLRHAATPLLDLALLRNRRFLACF
jgi:hypothetical protein